MSLLLVKYDRRAERVIECEPTELDADAARRVVMARNANGLTRQVPHLIWQVRELGAVAQPAPGVFELVANLERELAARAARRAS
ncbi:MAG TPA: hypothetical protein VIW26_12040 [Gemmatimonadales bacterium]